MITLSCAGMLLVFTGSAWRTYPKLAHVRLSWIIHPSVIMAGGASQVFHTVADFWVAQLNLENSLRLENKSGFPTAFRWHLTVMPGRSLARALRCCGSFSASYLHISCDSSPEVEEGDSTACFLWHCQLLLSPLAAPVSRFAPRARPSSVGALYLFRLRRALFLASRAVPITAYKQAAGAEFYQDLGPFLPPLTLARQAVNVGRKTGSLFFNRRAGGPLTEATQLLKMRLSS